MTPEEELREQRQALNAALNNHDVQTAASFLHPDFLAQGPDGHSYDRHAAVLQLEQFLQPSMNLHSQVEVENVEVSGDSATLRVCRTERLRMDNPAVFWGCLAGAAASVYGAIAISTEVGYPSLWVRIVGIALCTFGFVCLIWLAFFMGRRSMHQTQRAQETWRRVDGRWLVAQERQLSPAIMKTRKPLTEVVVAVVAAVAVGAFVVWIEFTPGPSTEYQRYGDPAVKFEARRASTEKVEGWKPTATLDAIKQERIFYVSPQVELSNEDVLSTGVYFTSYSPKPPSRWRAGAITLFFSVALFVVWWHDKKWWWGVSGGVVLLLGLFTLWLGVTSTAERFERRGIWQVVIRFNDAGTKKMADLTAKELVFLVDGELFFTVRRHSSYTGGLYFLQQGFAFQPNRLSKEDATRIAKGIAGP